jgi:hypothetical protein
MKPSEKSESEEYMMGDAYRVAKQAYDKQDKTMATRDAGLTQEQVEAVEVHAAGSSHCGEIKSKSASSRDSTVQGVLQPRRGRARSFGPDVDAHQHQ